MRHWIRVMAATAFVACAAAAAQERRIAVDIVDGKVSLLQLARKSLEAYGLPSREVRFSDFDVPARGISGGLLRGGLDAALGKAADVRLSKDKSQLLIVVDRRQTRRLRQKAKRRVLRWLSKLTGEDLLARRYVLEIPQGLRAEQPVVVLIHGVDGSAQTFTDLRAHLVKMGFAVGGFEYPNDEAIDENGRQLAKKLRTLGDRRVFLVAHSMGGLVARYAIETKGLDPGNVDKLIMLGTPNHGSWLAVARFLIDVGGYLKRPTKSQSLLATLYDGLGEAGQDLRPGSVVLQALNANRRNPKVSYKLILGTKAPVDRASRSALLKKAAAHAGSYGAWLEKSGAEVDEIVNGLGDCAVTVARGKLEGAETLLLPLDHKSLVSRRGFLGSVRGEHPAFRAVVRWLRDD